jgi:hypothetical protein
LKIASPSTAEEEQDALFVLRSDPWARRSDSECAKYLGCKLSLVKRLRKEHNLEPTFIEVVDAKGNRKTVQVGKKKRKLPKLSAAQQKLVEIALPDMQREAHNQANGLFDEQELLSIGHLALMTSARYWKPEGRGLIDEAKFWKVFAYRQVITEFNRVFKVARERQGIVSLIQHGIEPGGEEQKKLEDFGTPEDRDILVDRFNSLTGLTRLTVEHLAGMSPPGPRSIDDLARFWRLPKEVVMEYMVSEAREAMCS